MDLILAAEVSNTNADGWSLSNLTIISTIGAYAVALLLLFGAIVLRSQRKSGETDLSNQNEGGVPTHFYRRMDLLVFLAIAGLYLVLAMANGTTVRPEDGPTKIGVGDVAFGVILQFFIVAIPCAAMLKRVGLDNWLGLRWERAWQLLVIVPGGLLIMWSLMFGLHLVGYMEFLEELGVETVQEAVKILQEQRDIAVLIAMGLSVCIVAPITEEIIFRGYLYPVAKRFGGAWIAIVVTGIIFAAAHGGIMTLLPLTVFGILLAIVYEKTKSIWAPIGVHMAFNTVTFVVQVAANYYGIEV